MKPKKHYLFPSDYMADPAVHVFNGKLYIVQITSIEVCHQQWTFHFRLLQILGIGYQCTLCILLGVCVAKEEEVARLDIEH